MAVLSYLTLITSLAFEFCVGWWSRELEGSILESFQRCHKEKSTWYAPTKFVEIDF